MSDQPAVEAVDPQAIVKPLEIKPLDIQHDTDPADDHGLARRIPHLGHTVLFFSLALFFVFLCASIALAFLTRLRHVSVESAATDFPSVNLTAQAIAYVLALVASAWLFPRFWEKSFLKGIEWNFVAVKRYWPRLLAGGLFLSVAAQFAEAHFIHVPDHAPVDRVLTSQHGAYITAAVAVLFAPLFEEIAFRGFLLPAIATAYDWLALERSPAGLQRWESSTAHTTSALIFAALISSVPFALMHAAQISFAWGAVGLLYAVSLTLSCVRIRTHSVAASAFVHATYNLIIFLSIYISTAGFHHLEQFQR